MKKKEGSSEVEATFPEYEVEQGFKPQSSGWCPFLKHQWNPRSSLDCGSFSPLHLCAWVPDPAAPSFDVQASPMGQEAKLQGYVSNQDCVFSFNPSLGDNSKVQIQDVSVISRRVGLQCNFLNICKCQKFLANARKESPEKLILERTLRDDIVQAPYFIQEHTEA